MIPEFHEKVQCEQCCARIHQADAFSVLKYFGIDVGMKEIFFCNESEASEHYIDSLRKKEGDPT